MGMETVVGRGVGVNVKAEVAEVLGKWGARPKSLVNREEKDDEKRCRKASSSS